MVDGDLHQQDRADDLQERDGQQRQREKDQDDSQHDGTGRAPEDALRALLRRQLAARQCDDDGVVARQQDVGQDDVGVVVAVGLRRIEAGFGGGQGQAQGALGLGRAFGTAARAEGQTTVAVGRDGRLSGPRLVLADLAPAIGKAGPAPAGAGRVLPQRRFDAVVVTNYLWRPLLPRIRDSLAPGGVLLYETFACGQDTVGKPSRPDFLLQPGELLQAFSGLRVVAYEDGYLASPPRFVQRLAAVRAPAPLSTETAPPRYPL